MILAAGRGTRMESPLPKVVHKMAGIPMVTRVVRLSRQVGSERVVVIVGYEHETVRETLKDENVEFALQSLQLGTGHAVEQARPLLEDFQGDILILSGDVPALTAGTVNHLLKVHRETDALATLLTADVDDPKGYGRVIRNQDGTLKRIVEHKDASDDERGIREINAGIYVFDSATLFRLLPYVKNTNVQNEYYLPDVLPLILLEKGKVSVDKSKNSFEILGVNTVQQLEELNEIFRK